MSSQIVGAPNGAPTMYGLMVRSHNHVGAKLGAVLQAELADLVGARTKSQQLVGSSSYTVTFVKGQLPPVKGFW